MMSYQNTPTSIDEDKVAVPLGTTILLPSTTIMGHRLSKRMIIIVAGMLMMLMMAGGAVWMYDTMDAGLTTTTTTAAEGLVVVAKDRRELPPMDIFKANVNLRPYFENSYGYAVFESIKTTEERRFVKKAAWVVDGAYGQGAVYINTAKTVNGTADNVQTGTSKMLQATKRQHKGLKTPYPMIIFFETQQDYAKFATVGKDTFEFGPGTKVMAVPAKVVKGFDLPTGLYFKGIAAFTPTQLEEVGKMKHERMYKPPIAGQEYSFAPMGYVFDGISYKLNNNSEKI